MQPSKNIRAGGGSTHHSKSASVHGQESDIWDLYWSLALTQRTFAFSFWKLLFIPMMHASPCRDSPGGYSPPFVFYLFCSCCATGRRIRAASRCVFTYLIYVVHVPRCAAATSRNLQMCTGVEKWTGSQFWQAATQNDDWSGRKSCANKSGKSRSGTLGMWQERKRNFKKNK